MAKSEVMLAFLNKYTYYGSPHSPQEEQQQEQETHRAGQALAALGSGDQELHPMDQDEPPVGTKSGIQWTRMNPQWKPRAASGGPA